MRDGLYLDGKKILAVDDEPDVVETLEELLTMCDVTKARTFEKAKELLESQDFDIAILDIMGVEGYALLDIATKRDITTVMLTAHAFTPDNLVRSLKNGAASYLPKQEMGHIESFLIDILKSREEDGPMWEPWHGDLSSSYFERKWGEDWEDQDRNFWKKFNDQ
jgi:DNA-binding NtrC family response regulator